MVQPNILVSLPRTKLQCKLLSARILKENQLPIPKAVIDLFKKKPKLLILLEDNFDFDSDSDSEMNTEMINV